MMRFFALFISLVMLTSPLFAQDRVCSAGYCSAATAGPADRHPGRNPNAICLRIVQEHPDAVVIRFFDESGKLMRVGADGKEWDRYRPDLFPDGVGEIYLDRLVFDGVHHAVICNGGYHVDVTPGRLRELFSRKSDSCPQPSEHRVCLGPQRLCQGWDAYHAR